MDLVLKFDYFILDLIQNYMRCGFLDAVFVFFTRLGDSGFIWILLTLICLITEKYRKLGSCLAVSLVLCLLIGNEVLKELFARQRPFYGTEISLLITPPGGYSFPSGHTMSSFAAASAIGLTHKRYAKWAYILAGIIAFSRMYLYVHFLTDVLVGVLLGILFGYIGAAIIYRKLSFRRRR